MRTNGYSPCNPIDLVDEFATRHLWPEKNHFRPEEVAAFSATSTGKAALEVGCLFYFLQTLIDDKKNAFFVGSVIECRPFTI